MSEPFGRHASQLEDILGASDLGLWQFDHRTGQTTWNARVYSMLGRPQDEWPGEPAGWIEWVHPDDRPVLLARMNKALSPENPRYEAQFRMLRGDGRWLWVHSRGRVIERDGEGQPVRTAGTVLDIDEWKTMEVSLAASEERLQVLAETIDDVFWMADAALETMCYVSPAYERIWQRPVAELYANPKAFLEAVHPDDLPRILEDLDRRPLTAGFEHEYRILCPDGSTRWIWDRGFPIFDASGQATHYAGLAQDITERKQSEAAIRGLNVRLEENVAQRTAELEAATRELRQSEERFRFAMAASRIGLWDWQADGDAEFNPVLTATPDFEVGEPATGAARTWKDLVHPEDRPAVFAAVDHQLREDCGSLELECRLRAPDGSYRWLLFRGQVVERDGAGRPLRMTGTHTDIHQRKEADAALRLSREDLRRAQAVGRIGSWRLDLGSSRLAWSEEAHRLFGIPEGTPLTYETFLASVHPDDREYVDHKWQAALRGEPYDIEHRIRVADEVRWIRERAELEFDGQGRVLSAFGTTQDITERKRFEEALLEADRHKDEFLALLAHELRNPLAPLRDGLRVLRLAAGDPARLADTVAMMERQLLHMVRLIDDLLDLGRIRGGKIVLRKSAVDLAAVVGQAAETSRPVLAQAGLGFRIELPADPIPVEADLVRLAQAISNLLNNAAKFTAPGGQVWLALEANDGEAVVRVRDTGIGIPPAMLDRVFDLFTQLDRSLEKSRGGLGIGLNLVKRLVELHEGTVEAHSEGPGQGSEFRIRLPLLPKLAAPPTASVPGRPAAPAAVRCPRRILIADDNVEVAASLAQIFEILGHEVRTAGDGLEAVAAAAEFRPHLILLDIGMPRLNGYDACRRIKSEPWGRGIPIAAVTGWGQADDREHSRTAGFDHHFVKPVDSELLERLLDALPVGEDTPPG